MTQKKYSIRNMPLMEQLIDNTSNLASARSIVKAFALQQAKTNGRTISAYLKYLCNAFAFYRVRRYDIQGKRYLASKPHAGGCAQYDTLNGSSYNPPRREV